LAGGVALGIEPAALGIVDPSGQIVAAGGGEGLDVVGDVAVGAQLDEAVLLVVTAVGGIGLIAPDGGPYT
jgi:hypothetical protein